MRSGALVVFMAAACTNTNPPMCITVDTACQPLYPPTFDNVYANTLQGKCGSTSGSCHSATGHMGGMSFETEATAYAALTDAMRPRVVAGDPGCSLMIVRTDSIGAPYQMPPGDPLSNEHERCSLIQWVANGAPAPGVQ
jgi:hypothetical protein